MFRRSCKYQTLLCQFCYNPLQLKVLGICYSLQSCPAAMIYCETLLLNLYIIPFMTRKGQKSSIISVAIYILLYIVTYFTVPIPHLLKKLASHVLQNMFVITSIVHLCNSPQYRTLIQNYVHKIYQKILSNQEHLGEYYFISS